MGITPVFYDNHEEIPEFLQSFSNEINYWSEKESKDKISRGIIHQDEVGFNLIANLATGHPHPVKVRLVNDRIPVPANPEIECSVVSVGRKGGKLPIQGKQADSLIEKALHSNIINYEDSKIWKPVDKLPSFLFRLNRSSIFSIAARGLTDSEYAAPRDLTIIPEAMLTALIEIDKLGYKQVNFGALASGTGKLWHPIHPFAQTLVGIRKFLTECSVQSIQQINLFVVDPALWYPITAKKIPIMELLSSPLSTHKVELKDHDGNRESFSVTLEKSPNLKTLLHECDINPKGLKVDIFPRPTLGTQDPKLDESTIITSTMTVVLSPDS